MGLETCAKAILFGGDLSNECEDIEVTRNGIDDGFGEVRSTVGCEKVLAVGPPVDSGQSPACGVAFAPHPHPALTKAFGQPLTY